MYTAPQQNVGMGCADEPPGSNVLRTIHRNTLHILVRLVAPDDRRLSSLLENRFRDRCIPRTASTFVSMYLALSHERLDIVTDLAVVKRENASDEIGEGHFWTNSGRSSW